MKIMDLKNYILKDLVSERHLNIDYQMKAIKSLEKGLKIMIEDMAGEVQ